MSLCNLPLLRNISRSIDIISYTRHNFTIRTFIYGCTEIISIPIRGFYCWENRCITNKAMTSSTTSLGSPRLARNFISLHSSYISGTITSSFKTDNGSTKQKSHRKLRTPLDSSQGRFRRNRTLNPQSSILVRSNRNGLIAVSVHQIITQNK